MHPSVVNTKNRPPNHSLLIGKTQNNKGKQDVNTVANLKIKRNKHHMICIPKHRKLIPHTQTHTHTERAKSHSPTPTK